ncbi:MAG TPA: isoprenylcysteine carboxylmethyltransferase family protein [Thermoanaerobaculia bacterium]|nr:isoprenylcysteine carboxylmethyltransferase family protein [Thermoanaerobaculia bacterium]
MPTPLPFTWPYFLVFWPILVWVFIPEFGVVARASLNAPPAPEDRGSLQVILVGFSIAMFAAFGLSFVAPQAALPGNPSVWFFLGVLTLISGGLLRRHCFRVLDTFFTGVVTIQADHRVIESGAYRWVRHPSYSAALLIILGIAISLGNWLSVVVSFVIAFPAYSYRAHVEEQALLSSLGAPYAQFMATRKRFLPFIW